MRFDVALVLVLAACKQDYNLDPDDDPNDTHDTDVEVDIGDCDLEAAEARTVDIDPACETELELVQDPWNARLEWNWEVANSYYYGYGGVIVMPAVGNLTDDNGDGAVNDLDNPDIVFTTWFQNHLVALHGDGSGVIFDIPGYDGQGGPSIADVDSDGIPDVIADTTSHQIVAVSNTGTVKWTSAAFAMQPYPQSTVADLDEDGTVEVIFDVGVVDGRTGSTIATLPLNGGYYYSGGPLYRTPIAADLDQDGRQEIILGNAVFNKAGHVLWTNPGTGYGNFGAVADIDGDAGGEVMFVSGGLLYVHDDDGTLLSTTTVQGGTNPGPPSVADFDGDGEVEIAIPASTLLGVYEMDGTLNWSATMQDYSGLAGCSAYDVDGDGDYEVLFADETDLRIYDGHTGEVLYDNPTHNSGTVWEYPVIADVDNDGSAEIIIASNGGEWQGIEVFGHNGDGWPKSGPTWATHDFAVTNVNPDGSVPQNPPASWAVNNVFRARPSVDEPGQPDVFVEVTDACITTCDAGGTGQIAFQVGNAGAVRVLQVVVQVVDADGDVVTSARVGPIDPGTVLAGGVLEVDAAAIRDGFSVVVDASDGLHECDETNNRVSSGAICE